jgi:hypothetical protein
MTTSVNTARTGIGSAQLPRSTWANLPAAPADGTQYLVTAFANFTPRTPQLWAYSVANAGWFPMAPALVYESAALVSGVVQAATQILLAMPVDAGVLAGKVFALRYTYAKSGATDTLTPQIYFGALGTTADHLYTTIGDTVSTANRSVGNESWFRMTSATAGVRLGGVAASSFSGTQSATTQVANAAVVFDTVASANYVSLGCTMSGTTDTPQVGYCALWVLP